MEARVGIEQKTTANWVRIARFSGPIKRTLSLLERTPSLPFGAHFDARSLKTTQLWLRRKRRSPAFCFRC